MSNPNWNYETLGESLAKFEESPEGQALLARLDALYGPAADRRHRRVMALREHRKLWRDPLTLGRTS